jgi:glutamine amidotransferase-like uncharacterized protein
MLLFDGTGTSPQDVTAIESILKGSQLGYVRVDAEHLDAMSQSQIQAYQLLIVPGGNFVDIGNSLTAGAIDNVRNAVKGGLNDLGICAGAFLAGSFPAPYRNFDLTSDVKFGFYSAEKSGVRKTVVRITTAEGPELLGWGDAIAMYAHGTPAITEGSLGDGWIILTGLHAEAPGALLSARPIIKYRAVAKAAGARRLLTRSGLS